VSNVSTADRRETYMEAIRQKVCSVCLDARDDQSCGLTGRVCAIEEHLPGVAAAIAATRSTRLDDYLDAIRSEVCRRCRHQDAAGACELRGAADCALETYLYLVVEAIEDVEGPLLPEPREPEASQLRDY
jgi:hypothetical protein